LILKDVGGPTVIGMMALDEIVQVFEQFARSGNPPLGHWCGDAVAVFKALLQKDATQGNVADALVKSRLATSFDPDTMVLAMNIVARKATQVRRGPVTDTLILASEPGRTNALHRRAARAYDELNAGKTLADVVRGLDAERQATVEQRVSARFSRQLGKDVRVRITKLAAGARRESKLARRWLAFDADVDAEVTVEGVTTRLDSFVHKVVPSVAKGERKDLAEVTSIVSAAVNELLVAGNVIVNVTVPAAMAAVLGRHSPAEAAEIAEIAAYVSAGIPGAKARAEHAASMAVRIAIQSE
jgi:hypothetical protein